MYSQNNEEQIILEYFKDFKGHLLDIGANDGMTLSNSRRLIELGWSADLVEPSPITFNKLDELYEKEAYVATHLCAITDTDGEIEFFDSGSHLNQGDTSLVSTASVEDFEKWKDSTTWKKIEVTSYTFKTFLEFTSYDKFDFITIDAEGYDLCILKQIDLKAVDCKLICIEHNGKNTNLYVDYIKSFGFKLIHINNENLIMGV